VTWPPGKLPPGCAALPAWTPRPRRS
jgi:hypothetical protein